MTRWGITVPFDGPLHEQRERFEECAELGYTDFWSSEADGTDGLTPLALASTWTPSMRLGQAILPVYTRGPALLAQSAAALVETNPGNVAIGIGASSNVIVERWNGLTFDRPYQRVRDTLRFLKRALAGEKITEEFETFSVRGFKLGRPLPPDVPPPPVLVAALRPGMLRLAGKEGDGAIINWLSAEDVATVVPHVHEGGPDKEVVCRIFCAPTDDAEQVRSVGRYVIATYLNVPVYAAFHEWLGRGALLADMWAKWKNGDRQGAIAAIPDEVVDDLIVHGSPEACRAQIQRYVDNGVTTTALAIMGIGGVDVRQAVRDLAPRLNG